MLLIQIALLCPGCITVQRVWMRWGWRGLLAKTRWVNYLKRVCVRARTGRSTEPPLDDVPLSMQVKCQSGNQSGIVSLPAKSRLAPRRRQSKCFHLVIISRTEGWFGSHKDTHTHISTDRGIHTRRLTLICSHTHPHKDTQTDLWTFP